MAVRADFVVAIVMINDHVSGIIYAATKRIFTQDADIGEAQAAFLATHTASLYEVHNLILEENAINIILAIQNPSLFMDWNFGNVIVDIILNLLAFSVWKAVKF